MGKLGLVHLESRQAPFESIARESHDVRVLVFISWGRSWKVGREERGAISQRGAGHVIRIIEQPYRIATGAHAIKRLVRRTVHQTKIFVSVVLARTRNIPGVQVINLQVLK